MIDCNRVIIGGNQTPLQVESKPSESLGILRSTDEKKTLERAEKKCKSPCIIEEFFIPLHSE